MDLKSRDLPSQGGARSAQGVIGSLGSRRSALAQHYWTLSQQCGCYSLHD